MIVHLANLFCLLPSFPSQATHLSAHIIMAHRREGKSSDESENSEALSIAQNARISQQYLATDLGLLADSAILKRSLSLNSVISTTSSFSLRFQNARSRPELQYLNQIGIGLQGAVFEQVGKPLALKKESPGNEKLRSNLHQDDVHVPKPYKFISREENSAFWDEILPRTPPAYRMRGDLVMMERILPLPKVVRKALISLFCIPEQHLTSSEIEAILNHPGNKHCLARVYLGKASGPID
ncbi:unnamed protein product [Penicillium nalgiovense]|nr:unnamed protein product [Penicillium nalgiovense]